MSFPPLFCHREQFSKECVKGDEIRKEIAATYNVDVFKKELDKMKKTQEITNWKHKDEEISTFMRSIADDYGLIHEFYPETIDANPNDAKWERLYQQILAANNYAMSTDAVIDRYETKIQAAELAKAQALLTTPHVKKRSKLKQIRLHLNEGITRAGFATLNDIFKKGYIRKKDVEAAILIDGFFEDLNKTNEYKEWQAQRSANKAEFASLGHTIKGIDEEFKHLTHKLTTRSLSAEKRAMVKERRKVLGEEKQRLIHRRFELNDKIEEDRKNPLPDPKRDPSWDRRLMTNWSAVWDRWTSVCTVYAVILSLRVCLCLYGVVALVD